MMTTTPTRPRSLRAALTTVAELAATPLVPADYLDLFAPLRTGAALRARIVDVRPETADAATVVLRPGRDWRSHVPGQYLRVGVDVDGVRLWRAYSITSRPDRPDGLVTITVKAIPDGRVSTHLVRHARTGDLVHLEQAEGDFTLPPTAPPTSLFVVAGSGITPAMGMLRSRLDDLDDVVVVHCAMSADDAIFRDELRALDGDGRIRLVEYLTDRDGLLDPRTLDGLVDDLDTRPTWACGPAGLLDAIESAWDEAGRRDLLHTERFRPSVVPGDGEGGTVTFARSDREVDVQGSTTLLDAGEDAGVLMPSGCRMGICFGCVVPLRRGAVQDLRTGEVTTADPGDDVTVQTCVTTAATACELDV